MLFIWAKPTLLLLLICTFLPQILCSFESSLGRGQDLISHDPVSVDLESIDYAEQQLLKLIDLPAHTWIQHYNEFYKWLASLAKRRVVLNINFIVDPILEKLREDLVFYNRTGILLPTLYLTVPDPIVAANATFTNVVFTGGETLTRNGDATLEIMTDLTLVLDLPFMIHNGSVTGDLRVELWAFVIDSPFAGGYDGAKYEIGLTLPFLGLPQVTKLRVVEQSDANIDLFKWKTALAIILTGAILFIIILIATIAISISICCMINKIRKLKKELKD